MSEVLSKIDKPNNALSQMHLFSCLRSPEVIHLTTYQSIVRTVWILLALLLTNDSGQVAFLCPKHTDAIKGLTCTPLLLTVGAGLLS